MVYQYAQLKVERVALAEKSKVCRDIEDKWRDRARKAAEKQKSQIANSLWDTRSNIANYRRTQLRMQARQHHLANAYLRGLPYYEVEQIVWSRNIPFNSIETFWVQVAQLAYRYTTWAYREEINFDRIEFTKKVIAWRNEHPGFVHSSYMLAASRETGTPVVLIDGATKYGDIWYSIFDGRGE